MFRKTNAPGGRPSESFLSTRTPAASMAVVRQIERVDECLVKGDLKRVRPVAGFPVTLFEHLPAV